MGVEVIGEIDGKLVGKDEVGIIVGVDVGVFEVGAADGDEDG